MFIVFFEIVGLSWGFGECIILWVLNKLESLFQGAERVASAMEDMMGFRPSRMWIILWKYLSPLACIVRFIYHFINLELIDS